MWFGLNECSCRRSCLEPNRLNKLQSLPKHIYLSRYKTPSCWSLLKFSPKKAPHAELSVSSQVQSVAWTFSELKRGPQMAQTVGLCHNLYPIKKQSIPERAHTGGHLQIRTVSGHIGRIRDQGHACTKHMQVRDRLRTGSTPAPSTYEAGRYYNLLDAIFKSPVLSRRTQSLDQPEGVVLS